VPAGCGIPVTALVHENRLCWKRHFGLSLADSFFGFVWSIYQIHRVILTVSVPPTYPRFLMLCTSPVKVHEVWAILQPSYKEEGSMQPQSPDRLTIVRLIRHNSLFGTARRTETQSVGTGLLLNTITGKLHRSIASDLPSHDARKRPITKIANTRLQNGVDPLKTRGQGPALGSYSSSQ
jgi:hypothetical protein